MNTFNHGDFSNFKERINIDYVNNRDFFGNTILHDACVHNNIEAIVWLCNLSPITATVANNVKCIPIFYFIRNAYPECIPAFEFLLKASDVNLHLVYHRGDNLLHQCAFEGKYEYCKVLLEHSKKLLYETNTLNNTPLDLARKGFVNKPHGFIAYRKITKLFIDYGSPIGNDSKEEPWIANFIKYRKNCKSTAKAMLELRKRNSRLIGVNGRDVLGLIAKHVWRQRLLERE